MKTELYTLQQADRVEAPLRQFQCLRSGHVIFSDSFRIDAVRIDAVHRSLYVAHRVTDTEPRYQFF